MIEYKKLVERQERMRSLIEVVRAGTLDQIKAYEGRQGRCLPSNETTYWFAEDWSVDPYPKEQAKSSREDGNIGVLDYNVCVCVASREVTSLKLRPDYAYSLGIPHQIDWDWKDDTVLVSGIEKGVEDTYFFSKIDRGCAHNFRVGKGHFQLSVDNAGKMIRLFQRCSRSLWEIYDKASEDEKKIFMRDYYVHL